MDDNSTLAPIPVHKIAKGSLTIGKLVGEGDVATVHEATDRHGKTVAIRQVRSAMRFKFDMKRRFANGVEFRRRLGRHPNVTQYIGEGSTFMQPFEVIELVEGKSLRTLIEEKADVIWKEPLWILRQCVAAIIHVHNQNYLHLNIRAENFLVGTGRGRPTVKLTDFDFCQTPASASLPKRPESDLVYLPPEYLREKTISPTIDIFAFGVMAYYVYVHAMPFSSNSLAAADANGRYDLEFPKDAAARMGTELQTFIRKCLAASPDDRFGDGYQLFLALEELHKREMKRRRGPDTRPPRPGMSLG